MFVAARNMFFSLQHEDASVLMFDYLLDQPLPDYSRTEERISMSSSHTLHQALMDEGLDEQDVVFIKELILGCPIGKQHLAKCDPTVSYSC